MRKSKVGQLSNRITIQAATLTADGAGGGVESWVNALTVWAEAMPMRSDRLIDAIGNQIHSDVIFRLRTGTGIGKKNRILYEGRVCVIDGIRDWHQDREFQLIDCTYNDTGASVSGVGGGYTTGLQAKYLTITAGTTITDTSLIGKNILNVQRNGIGLKLTTTPTSGEDYNYASGTGEFTFGSAVALTEYILVIYA